MMPLRRPLIAALAATAALAVGAPAASASTVRVPTTFARLQARQIAALSTPSNAVAGPCGIATTDEGQSRTGGTSTQACVGAGPTFIGPEVGQNATVIGPTPAVAGVSIVAGGNVAIGP
jgi:hypothetical protein